MKPKGYLLWLSAVVVGWGLVSLGSAIAFQPSKAVEVVVHTGPGGGSDLFARAIADLMQKENLIPQRMQVVNKSGGGSAVAMAYLAEKKGETHTIDRKSTRLNSSHIQKSRMPSSA